MLTIIQGGKTASTDRRKGYASAVQVWQVDAKQLSAACQVPDADATS